MERLISVHDGEAKRVVTSVGQSGIFYASAFTTLKRNFGNPVVVSYMKLKTVVDLPQLPPNDYNGLRVYHQTLEVTVMRLVSMGCNAAIKSTEGITKAVHRLPKYMKSKFQRDFEEKLYGETKYNLQVFERWLGSKLDEIYNPKAVIIKSEEKKKLKKEQKSSNNCNLPKDGYVYRTFLLSEDSKKDNEGKKELRCWICRRNHKVTDCNEIKNKAYNEKINLVKSKKLCFNCLLNTHTISNCKT